MIYKESKEILKIVKKSENILLNCHRSPDPDSIGCALSLKLILESMNKKVTIICPSEKLYDRLDFLSGYREVNKGTNFSTFDYKKYDLFITTDSSSWDMVAGSKDIQKYKIPIAVVDHHKTNERYGDINLVDENSTSVGEILFNVFQDWKVKLNKDVSTCLLSAIVGDTGAFRYPKSTHKTFSIASQLMKWGADKDFIVYRIYQSEPFELIKFYGYALTNIKIDKENKFVWTAIPYEIFSDLGKPISARESVSSLFAQVTEGTDFGIVMVEEEKNILRISFRSRTGFDTTKIAIELGGGGHIYASGAKIEGLEFNNAVEKVLDFARKYAKEHIKNN